MPFETTIILLIMASGLLSLIQCLTLFDLLRNSNEARQESREIAKQREESNERSRQMFEMVKGMESQEAEASKPTTNDTYSLN